MIQIAQDTQDHFIRRKRSIIPISIVIRKDVFSKLQAILRVARVTILRVKRYCSYCVRILMFVIGCLSLVGVSCCAYSTRSLLPDYIQKVHIKIFENRTVKAGLDELATNTVIEAFRSGSNLRIVDESSADIVIEGTVSGFSKDPYTYTSDQIIIEYKITIKFSIRCVDKIRNEVFWEGDVSEWATYSTDEDEGIDVAMEKTAERLVTTILTNW